MAASPADIVPPLDSPPLKPLFGGAGPDVDRHSCRLLGPVALVVQGIMGALVLGSLVYKRHRENPRRPWKIWICDVSKQVLGQAFVHGANVLVSDLFALHGGQNACSGYFLNITIDTTIGVGIIFVILKLFSYIFVTKLNYQRLRSGQYGSPPSFLSWFLQLIVYIVAITVMKLFVVALLAVAPSIFKFSDWVLSELSEDAQVVVVMCLWPLVMNILQFWLIDSLLKSKSQPTPHAHKTLEDDDADDADRPGPSSSPRTGERERFLDDHDGDAYKDNDEGEDEEAERPARDIEEGRGKAVRPANDGEEIPMANLGGRGLRGGTPRGRDVDRRVRIVLGAAGRKRTLPGRWWPLGVGMRQRPQPGLAPVPVSVMTR